MSCRICARCLVLAAATMGLSLFSARAEAPREGTVELKAFRFANGGELASLKLHYRTLGTPMRDNAGHVINAILLLHGTTGTAETMLTSAYKQELFADGKPLDAGRFFIVIPDGIGAGGSSKPSDGLRTRFPHYGYKDQVRAQHDMLTAMGIEHLKLVLGTSMGGMQTILWGETYPQQIDALVAIACTPAAISGRNMIWRAMIIEAIRGDPHWRGGDYPVANPPHLWRQTAWPLFEIMTSNSEQLAIKGPTRVKAAELVHDVAARIRGTDASDLLYLFESSADYDPAPALSKLTRPILTINFADDLLNPPELLNYPDAPNFSKVLFPAGATSYGHQSLAHPAVWARSLADFLKARQTHP